MKKLNLKEVKGKIKAPAFLKNHKKLFIFAGIILILLIVFLCTKFKGKETKSENVNTAKVTMGDVKVEITGSGTMEANEQYEITSLVKGDVIADYFEEGDIVSENDILYSIDPSSVNSSINRQKNSVSKASTSYQNAVDDYNNLNIKAPISGTITELNIKKGDAVNNGSVVAKITDKSKMILDINFNSVDAESLYVGAPATVTLSGSSYQVNGNVSKIASGTVLVNGIKATPVEITVSNPGSIDEGDKATAISNSVACLDYGTFDVFATRNVRAEVSGDVANIYAKKGDVVTQGSTIVSMTSKSVTQNLENARLSKEDSQLNLDDLYDNLDDYTITAPISGTVISKTVKKGDKLDNGQGAATMAIIADMSKMLFTISVDELDISKITEGQNVNITCDAIEGKKYTGYVDEVSIVGTTNNGVTTYPVTVVVNDPEGLIPGMNVDASIAVEEKNNCLTVPLSAVQRGNIVYVLNEDLKSGQGIKNKNKANTSKETQNKSKSAKSKDFKDPYEGYTAVKIEVGLSNADVAEVVSGVYEGQHVLIVSAAKGNDMQNGMMNMHNQMTGGASGGQNGGMSGGQNRMSGGQNRMSGGPGGAF